MAAFAIQLRTHFKGMLVRDGLGEREISQVGVWCCRCLCGCGGVGAGQLNATNRLPLTANDTFMPL